tara:strand:+ start:557 stop:1489 length:933 start_codon:yes stop_codon:yes gene_type:complete
MYHRFGESKYPSTNISINDFKKQIELIKNEDMTFINSMDFEKKLLESKNERKMLLTIDDGFTSFYQNAWPFLKKENIPFILFVNTREVGSSGYMNWDQIREVSKSNLAHIGNHSHSHEYMVDWKIDEIKKDITKSIDIFEKELGYKSIFFSYPFGEYSLEFRSLVAELGFKYAFGQHSGVIDLTKNNFELPRYPINEKYGEIKRFKGLLKTLPLKYEYLKPEEKYLRNSDNPPKVIIKFLDEYKNINQLNCFSNEEDKWRNSEIIFLEKNKIEIKLDGKFTTERGRINCSLREEGGFYRWLGIQFVIADK